MAEINEDSAVVVIDVQQGLCEGDGKAFECEAIIARINALTRKARSAGIPADLVDFAP
ncbi:MAG: isochorismatase family protein [Ramlibacter sp.]|nr:isochorismatase family protein [Ramlibacter sp.]